MDDLTDFALNEEYKRLQLVGDRLAEIESLIDWKPFRPILESMYKNRTASGGRPEADVIVMFKMLVLQQWHGLSDPELERQCIDRISFRKFLGFPEYVPDNTTVWSFRKRIIDNGKEKQIWNEMQRQLNALGLEIKKGTIQDATFIHSNPGHAKADTPRGEDAKTTRSRDGTWVKKGGKCQNSISTKTRIETPYLL
ncbi:Transposase domain [Methanohalophilus euhalobius]|uniref:Transposase domain n=1 Tax=Methanohalophilus euhalobius TaxID=51203 RepID=A0A285GHL1_9EURY|nr:Transposase domain [Methanohalophilus euhalobius]